MNPWTGVAVTTALVILVFTSTILGLIRHNVLQDPATCCLVDTVCSEVLRQQGQSYYDPVLGLRTRYIAATVIFFFVLFLRLPPVSLPSILAPLQNSTFLALVGQFAYTLQLLFADLALHNLADPPTGLLDPCSLVSAKITGAINVLAWFSLVLSSLLFFLFMVSQNTVHHYIPVLRFSKAATDDDEEEIVFGGDDRVKKGHVGGR